MAKSEILSDKDVYEEIGKTYRYFLNWRHAAFAGYILILYTLLSQYFGGEEITIQHFALWGVIVLTGIFWMVEYRIRDLYKACTSKGAMIEKRNKLDSIGIYSQLESGALRNKLISHTHAFEVLFLIMLFLAAILLFKL